MGLNVAGVDLLRSNHGPVVMEVNSSPGPEGIEKATQKDIAGMMIEFIEKDAAPGAVGRAWPRIPPHIDQPCAKDEVRVRGSGHAWEAYATHF